MLERRFAGWDATDALCQAHLLAFIFLEEGQILLVGFARLQMLGAREESPGLVGRIGCFPLAVRDFKRLDWVTDSLDRLLLQKLQRLRLIDEAFLIRDHRVLFVR